MPSNGESSWNARLTIIFTMSFALLIGGCIRFTYDETPGAIPGEAAESTPLPDESEATPSPTETPVVEGPVTLYMEPSLLDMSTDQTREVEVMLDNVVDLHTIELHISFEPRYVSIEDVDPNTEGVQIAAGPLLPSTQVIRNEVENATGLIIYRAQSGKGAGQGSGVAASFRVRSLTQGGSPLRFNVAELQDTAGKPITLEEQIDGLVVIGAGDKPSETPERPSPTAPVPAPTEPATEACYHTVQAGENLFRIALRYDTTVEAIAQANGITDPTTVQVGQKLLIPNGHAPQETYIVQPGDTLYAIARRMGMSVEEMARLNAIAPPYTIAAGQRLKVSP